MHESATKYTKSATKAFPATFMVVKLSILRKREGKRMAVFHVKLDPEIRFMDKRDEIKGIFGQKKRHLINK